MPHPANHWRVTIDLLTEILGRFLIQFQSPALAFLLGGILIAACGSRLQIPDAVYKFCVFMLLMRIGLEGGIEIRHGEIVSMLVPAVAAVAVGCLIVYLGRMVLIRLPGVQPDDAIATVGLFGAVSASTLAAAMVLLEQQQARFEAWVPALYPFMDIPALVLAIVLANIQKSSASGVQRKKIRIMPIVLESLQGSALSALLLGILLGLLAHPESVFETFYDPLFQGFLSVLMLTMGLEAYSRLVELRAVAHWYALYAAIAPILHGLLGFAFGYIAHVLTGFSPAGVVLLAVMAGSSSDISGPPTLRAGIPSANPSAYIGASTSVGTPVAIVFGIPLYIALADWIFGSAA